MRFLADEDFPLPAVTRLRQLGHDVVTALEAGIANDETLDLDVLQLATSLNRSILTHNRRHFRRLHRDYPEHGGIVMCTRDSDFARLADRINEATVNRSDLRGAIISVVRPDSPK